MISDSDSGVSITRSSPNSAWSPSVARNTPPFSPTSSPRRMTASSRRISEASVSRIASMNVLRAISEDPRQLQHHQSTAPSAADLSPSWPSRPCVAPKPQAGGDSPGQSSANTHFIAVSGVGSGGVLGVVGRLVDLDLHLRGDRGLDLVGQDACVPELAPEARQRIRRP